MGDRANVVVVDEFDLPPVYLYTHWGGDGLAEVLAGALALKERWDDGPYLARIIFDKMTGLDGRMTGYGISTAPPDNEHPYLVVDVARRRVLIGDASRAADVRQRVADPSTDWAAIVPFAEHARLNDAYLAAHANN